MWKWVQKIILLFIVITHLGFANNDSPQWGSFNAIRIKHDTKTVFASVKFANGKNQLIFVQANSDTNVLSWGLAEKIEKESEEGVTFRPINSDDTNLLTPFELMRIRESVRNERIFFDLIVGRNISHVEEIELNEAYKNNASFFSGVEHFLLSSWYEQIEYYIEHSLKHRHSNLIEKIKLGISHEQRPIYAYKVACPNNSSDINLIWISLEHARERTTVQSNLYAMQHFLHQLTVNPQDYCNTSIWFIPIFNPDGFVYANTHNEMWRKNRRPVSNTNQKGEEVKAVGVDIARNFFDPECPQDFRLSGDQNFPDDDKMFQNGNPTFSDDPNSDIYRGSKHSEAETQALINLVKSNDPKISFNSIVTLHSAEENGGIFHLDDQEPRNLARYIQSTLNGNGYEGYQAQNIDELYNHSIPGIPELYMHNRGIPMLTIELKLNQSTSCYNPFDPPLEQYIEDQYVTKNALFANIHYWQDVLEKHRH